VGKNLALLVPGLARQPLKKLNLDFTSLTAASLAELVKLLEQVDSLEEVDLRDNMEVPGEGAAAAQASPGPELSLRGWAVRARCAGRAAPTC